MSSYRIIISRHSYTDTVHRTNKNRRFTHIMLTSVMGKSQIKSHMAVSKYSNITSQILTSNPNQLFKNTQITNLSQI